MENRNEYIDNEEMPIVFSSLIINVASINKKYGALNEFMAKFDLSGQTNGKLLIVAEMTSPPFHLINIVETQLHPLGFTKKQDYVFAAEELIHGVGDSYTPYLNQPHPACENISWLGSVIKTDGNFVWYKKPLEQEKEESSPTTNFYVEEEEISLHCEMKNLRAKRSFMRDLKIHHGPIYDYQIVYIKELSKLDDRAFIELFNTHIDRKYFDNPPKGYLKVVHHEFDKRNMDYSAIGNEKAITFAKKIKLIGKKVITI